MKVIKVTVVTVVYGKRWNLLQQVAEASLADDKVTTFVIVDNGCADAVAMDAYTAQYGSRIVILRQTKNIGYSGAISKGMAYARDTECDFVFVLDDDSVPEPHAIDYFLENLKFFANKKVVLAGNRVNVPGNEKIFNKPIQLNAMPKGTVFDILRLSKLVHVVRLLLRVSDPADGQFVPIVPMEAFVTGGSFIPIEAVREAPLPDGSLFIYGEDLEYSWKIRKLGYACYVCARPKIFDIDLTFSSEGNHIFGLFDPAFASYKVYFRLRNAVIISRRNTVQSPIVLFINIVLWMTGLILLGLITVGPTKSYFGKVRIILRAARDGYYGTSQPIPPYVTTPV
jgi:rhamnopyranosyl-N-acetylglucosaminyl-diphospho-decaprenol beta-1,3/1,4-galactofuranosyltransferase